MGEKCSPIRSPVGTESDGSLSETVPQGINCEAQGHVLKKSLRREQRNFYIQRAIYLGTTETEPRYVGHHVAGRNITQGVAHDYIRGGAGSSNNQIIAGSEKYCWWLRLSIHRKGGRGRTLEIIIRD